MDANIDVTAPEIQQISSSELEVLSFAKTGNAEARRTNSQGFVVTKNEATERFFHGTKAELRVGDLLTAGHTSNYKDGLVMNHVYFTAWPKGAGLAAEIARGAGRPRVYIVEPTGEFEDDPNVTDKKYPGNPTRSYRSRHPLKVVGEIAEWEKFDADFIRELRRKVKEGMGDIIN